MGDERDDTVIVAPRAIAVPTGLDTDDTILTDHSLPREPRTPPRVPSDEPAALAGIYGVRIGRGGEAIPLDVPCHVGRKPSAPRVSTGATPRLVQVASPGKEVSATHIEVRQLGSTVVVTDLRSTNGSIVMVPGGVPRTLRQGESVVVSPGTLIDIGDDNVIQILSVQQSGSAPTERQS